jgi:hypothetical protein
MLALLQPGEAGLLELSLKVLLTFFVIELVALLYIVTHPDLDPIGTLKAYRERQRANRAFHSRRSR